MFKFEHYKQSNGFQCQLSLSNYYGNHETPIISSNRFFTDQEKIKRWALSNTADFLTGTLDAYIIRLKAIKKEIFEGKKGGDILQRSKFMTNYWLVLELHSKINYSSTPFAKAEMIKEYFGALTESIPHDKELGFQLFLDMVKDLIKATNFILKANKSYKATPANSKTTKNATRL